MFICIFEYKNKFCGLPNGVKMLPKFAAIVCNTITIGANLRFFVSFRIKIAKGTKVISATSFVINMLEKKQSKINAKEIERNIFILQQSLFARKEKTPRL